MNEEQYWRGGKLKMRFKLFKFIGLTFQKIKNLICMQMDVLPNYLLLPTNNT